MLNEMRQDKFAKKHLGQNFLTNLTVRDQILEEAGDIKGKRVLEIGPGLGFLTEKLLESGANLTAVELDERAVKILTQKFGDRPNFKLVEGDILQQDLGALMQQEPYLVIANIPYNITNPIIRKLLELTNHSPEVCILMVQKEVAQKICDPVAAFTPEAENAENTTAEVVPSAAAKILSIPLQGQPAPVLKPEGKPSKKGRSIISIAVEVYAQARYCFTVDRTDFEPAPKVDSAIMRFDVRPEPLVPEEIRRDFFTVVNAGFSEKRKKLGNVLGKYFGLTSTELLGGIDGNRRAETLNIEEWVEITKNFKSVK